MTVILLFLHVPQFYGRNWEREADLLAMFFFLTVTWDVLWFACNRHFGMARFRKGQIWWFPAWALGVPRPYLMAIVLSLAAALAPALWTGAWVERAQHWGLVFVELLALTIVAIAIMRVPRRRRPRRAADQARVIGKF
jgi:purine-cytosine permease-like protein